MTGGVIFHPQTSEELLPPVFNTKRSPFFLVNKIQQTVWFHYPGRYCISWEKNCFANCHSFKSNFEKMEVSIMFHLYRNHAKAHFDASRLFRILFCSVPTSKFIGAVQVENTRIELNTDDRKRLWSAVHRWSSVACNTYGLLYVG